MRPYRNSLRRRFLPLATSAALVVLILPPLADGSTARAAGPTTLKPGHTVELRTSQRGRPTVCAKYASGGYQEADYFTVVPYPYSDGRKKKWFYVYPHSDQWTCYQLKFRAHSFQVTNETSANLKVKLKEDSHTR